MKPCPKIRFILAILLIDALLIACGAYAYMAGYWRFVTPDSTRYPLTGIDVSHHQGTIDWPTVAQQNIAFAFIKATEGGTHVDSLLQQNWQGATTAGIPAAPYHFFTLCRVGEDQATHFLTATAAMRGPLPEVVDLEFIGNCKARPSMAEFQTQLRKFLTRVESATNRKMLFYTTYAFQSQYLKNAFPENPVWIRDIFRHPRSSQPFTFWQYADHARLPGITGPLDLNTFNGNISAWKSYLKTPAQISVTTI